MRIVASSTSCTASGLPGPFPHFPHILHIKKSEKLVYSSSSTMDLAVERTSGQDDTVCASTCSSSSRPTLWSRILQKNGLQAQWITLFESMCASSSRARVTPKKSCFSSTLWCKILRKNGLQAQRITLWDSICRSSSLARVTSKKSCSSITL